MTRLWIYVRTRFAREDGAGLVEYGFLVMLIAVVALVAVTTFGQNVGANLDESAKQIAEAGTS